MLSNRILRASISKASFEDVPSLLKSVNDFRSAARHVARQHQSLHSNGLRRASSSSTRWKSRQGKDHFAREARVQGLKSRAAFKLLEIDAKYKLFKRGQTVVDLGFAPGSWSQVAVERTKPTGRIIGIDVIPAQPPKGVSTIQGNFLSKEVQEEVKRFLLDPDHGRPLHQPTNAVRDTSYAEIPGSLGVGKTNVDMELHGKIDASSPGGLDIRKLSSKSRLEVNDEQKMMVDIVLSDMSAPWEQTTGFWKQSLSGPYNRMMNTSGINFKDHAGSMDLCAAALQFSYDTLKVGGHLVCKFYQGGEDRELEMRLKTLFAVVHREKPNSSRSESKEAYFVALRRRHDVKLEEFYSSR